MNDGFKIGVFVIINGTFIDTNTLFELHHVLPLENDAWKAESFRETKINIPLMKGFSEYHSCTLRVNIIENNLTVLAIWTIFALDKMYQLRSMATFLPQNR